VFLKVSDVPSAYERISKKEMMLSTSCKYKFGPSDGITAARIHAFKLVAYRALPSLLSYLVCLTSCNDFFLVGMYMDLSAHTKDSMLNISILFHYCDVILLQEPKL